ncbi:hypothetical protein B566_EDAN007858 [Ephemera danica]|nr:hypothetical protein B566_EDAN007858 [Ephemera danica]
MPINSFLMAHGIASSSLNEHRIRLASSDGRDDHSSRCGLDSDSSGQSSYITVIPVEFSRRAAYPPPAPDYLVEQYSEYLRERARDEYLRGDYNINSDSQYEESGPLYTLTQRYDHTPNYSPHDVQVAVFLFSPVVVALESPRNVSARDLALAVMQEEQLGLPRSAASVFAIWMASGLLEVQLKPHHRPLEVRQSWQSLLSRYSGASESRRERDEPRISLQRNVFFTRAEEEKETKYNILEGRYPCETSHYIMLGGLQARIELGPYNPQLHTPDFFRQQQGDFLPAHVRRGAGWAWLPVSSKRSPEVRLLEAFKSVPAATPAKRLVRKYLEFCWALPFYGSAFFAGQVEQPVRGLTSLITHQDIPVLVAVNEKGVHVIDEIQCTVLLGLRYEEMSWEYARPSQEDSPDCLPCLFIQFMVLENGARVSKVLQVFSKQAVMMDALISTFVDRLKQKTADEVDRPMCDAATDTEELQAPLRAPQRRDAAPQSCLSNKLSRLTLATFDDEGKCRVDPPESSSSAQLLHV